MHGLTKRDRMAYVGTPPWHGLGVELPDDADIDRWRQEAGLAWRAVPRPLLYLPGGADQPIEIQGHVALSRSDTGALLGIVSQRYQPVQPDELLAFCERLVPDGFRMHTAGTLFGGRRVWCLMRSPEELVVQDDRVEDYLLVVTSYDGSTPTLVKHTAVRVVCNNTLNSSLRGRGWEYRAKHTRHGVGEELLRAYKAELKARHQQIQALMQYRLGHTDALDVLCRLRFGVSVNELADEGGTRELEKWQTYRRALRFSPGADMPTAKGTLWGVLNAYTWALNSEIGYRTLDRRFDRVMLGDVDIASQRAFRQLVDVTAGKRSLDTVGAGN